MATKEESGWLIEWHKVGSPISYLGVSCGNWRWTTANDALRFAREEDARNAARTMPEVDFDKLEFNEHFWVPPKLTWIDVSESTRVAAKAYDEDKQRIYIRFHSGVEWEYRDCPSSVWSDLMDTDSIGSFIHTTLDCKKNGKMGTLTEGQ